MSMNSLENEIVRCLREKLNNQKITKSWIQEWSTTPVEARPGDELVEILEKGWHVFVAIRKPEKKLPG